MDTLGARLARLRIRSGHTQEALAHLSQVSVSVIKKLEREERDSARLDTIHRLAAALGTTTTALLGTHIPAAPVGPRTEPAGLLAVRKALTPVRASRPEPVEGGPATAEQLRQALDVGIGRYRRDDYTTTIRAVPELLADAEAAVAEAGPGQRAALLSAQAGILNLVGSLLVHLRHFDLAYEALRQGRAAAQESGDDLAEAACVDSLCWMLIRQARFDEVQDVAVATADRIEPRMSSADPAHLAQWGWLQIRAATAAVRNTSYADADEHMRLAGTAAAATGQEVLKFRWQGFGPSLVLMKQTENEMIRHRPDRALALAERVTHPGPRTNNNRNRWMLDQAAAHVELRQYAAATATLTQVKTDAPEWLRSQSYAGQITADLVDRRARALPEDLVVLADFFDLG